MRAERAVPQVYVLGSINVDWVTRVERIACPGETVLGAGFECHFGGKGANQAVAAARAGADVAMIGAVGDDEDGARARANLETRRIDTTAVRVIGAEVTGRALVALAADGENAITVIPGANAQVLPDLPSGAAGVFVAQAEIAPAMILSAMREALSHGMLRVLNLAPVPAGLDMETARALMRLSDVLIVNETELAQLCDTLDQTGDIATLARRWAVALVVTLGARGAAFSAAGEPVQMLPASPVKVVDTTGAGDSFAGTLAAALAAGSSLAAAAALASQAAGQCCTHLGAQPAPEA